MSKNPRMQIDSHQHFWNYNAQEYGWIRPDWPICERFLPPDLEPLLLRHDISGSVVIQARQSLVETRWLLDLSSRYEFILGVVGWVDLCSDEVETSLGTFASHSKLVGVRHVIQDEPDDGFMLREDFQHGIAALARYDLTYDILIFPRQLQPAIQLVEKFPQQRFAVDHLAKPPIAKREMSPWREGIEQLALYPNVVCKISGFLTEASWRSWHAADFQPYFNTVLDAFGALRLMYGSDWPVALLSGSYDDAFGLVEQFISDLSPQEQKAIMGENAARFYGLTLGS